MHNDDVQASIAAAEASRHATRGCQPGKRTRKPRSKLQMRRCKQSDGRVGREPEMHTRKDRIRVRSKSYHVPSRAHT